MPNIWKDFNDKILLDVGYIVSQLGLFFIFKICLLVVAASKSHLIYEIAPLLKLLESRLQFNYVNF